MAKEKQVFSSSSFIKLPDSYVQEAIAYDEALIAKANAIPDDKFLIMFNALRRKYGLPSVKSLSECLKK